jgi:SAM-dependent methyltransferase
MVDERDDDEIFELTEDMASVPPPPAKSSGEEEEDSAPQNEGEKRDSRQSSPPHRPSSPFLQIAEPKTREKVTVPDPNSKTRESKRSSFVPQKRDVAVIAIPIQKLSGAGGRTAKAPQKPQKEETEKETSEGREKVGAESAAEQIETQEAIEEKSEIQAEIVVEEERGDGEEIFDLDQDLIAQAPAEKAQALLGVGSAESAREAERAEEAEESEAGDKAEAVETRETEPTEAGEPAEKAEAAETAEAGGQAEPEGEDLGTPEAVFDAFPEEEGETSTGKEAVTQEEEIDLVIAEEITDGKEEKEPGKEEEEEEIDLDEAEEVTEAGKVVAPSEAPKPPPAGIKMKMRRRRKRAKEWWADIFDDDYMTLMPVLNPRDIRREVDFIEKCLNVPKGCLLLDLCCGDGRHAVGLSRRGYRVVGVDLSLPMLARAGESAQEADQKINFIHGDMRDLGFDRTFDAVYCVGTSFGYFDEKTNFKVLEGVARALKPGAPFLLEVANRDHVIANQPNLTWFEGSGSVCMEETSFNYVTSRLDMVRNLILGDDGRQVKHELSLRLYSLHELGTALQSAGFKVTQVAGHISTPNAFFGSDSALIIIVASRRA